MKHTTVPINVSDQAKAFYAQSVPDVPMLDFTSVSDIQLVRDMVHPQWQALCEAIPYDYDFNKIAINGVRCYQIEPPTISHEDVVVLYIHGGSNFFGHPTLCKNIPVSVAHASGLSVISIEYRLAPEHMMPAAVDDILSVISGLKNHHGDHTRYALMGHSAGGGLALSAALQAKYNHIQQADALALIAPWVDMTVSGDTMQTLAQVDPNPPTHEWFYASVNAFLGGYDRTDPFVSPLFAGDTALNDLCPTYIQLAGRDRFSSDGIRLNQRFQQLGVESILDMHEGMWHGFQMHPLLPEAITANKATAHFLNAIFTKA